MPPKLPAGPGTRKSARVSQKSETKGKQAHGSKDLKRKQNEPDVSPRKRARQKNVKKGELWMMQEMPIDILHEIFGYLEPYDLLRLARTTRALRAILMSRNSRDIWAASFASMPGYPPCPEDMVEPQYANLMFSYHCHGCGLEPDEDGYILYMFMEARTQLCTPCARTEFQTFKRLSIPHSKEIAELLKCVPETTQRFLGLRELQNVPSNSTGQSKFHVATVKALHETHLKLEHNLEEYQQWLTDVKLKWAKIEKHAALCEDYMDRQLRMAREIEEEREVMLKRTQALRLEQIRERICAIGYTTEINSTYAEDLTNQEGVSGDEELTEEEWDKMKPGLNAWLATITERLEEEKRIALVRARCRNWVEPVYADLAISQSGALDFPSLLEVCMGVPELCSILESIVPEPTERAVQSIAKDVILPFIDDWRRRRESHMRSIIRQSSVYASSPELPDASVDEILRLASTMFECHKCRRTTFYPRAITHDCNNAPLQLSDIAGYMQLMGYEADFKTVTARKTHRKALAQPSSHGTIVCKALFGTPVWIPSNITTVKTSFHTAGYHHMQALLKTCDLPLTTTMEEMRSLDLHVFTSCSCFVNPYANAVGYRPLRWSAMLRHTKMHNGESYEGKFHLTDPPKPKPQTHFNDRNRMSRRYGLSRTPSPEVEAQVETDPVIIRREAKRKLLAKNMADQNCFVCKGRTRKVYFSSLAEHLVNFHGVYEAPAKRFEEEFIDNYQPPI